MDDDFIREERRKALEKFSGDGGAYRSKEICQKCELLSFCDNVRGILASYGLAEKDRIPERCLYLTEQVVSQGESDVEH